MLDNTKATAVADKPDFAADLQDFTTGPAGNASPLVVPVTVDRIERPPKPAPPPSSQVDAQRVFDAKGKIVGLDLAPLAGNAVTRIELRDLKGGRWRVKIYTEPRRGRSFQSQRRA